MIEHLSPEFVVSSLRLLVESYKLARERFKDKKTPEHVEEIIITIREERNKQKNVDMDQVERLLTSKLEASDAAVVKSDLQLLNLLVLASPDPEMFDYWGMLTTLVAAIHKFAVEHRIFELRGVQGTLGEVLKLERTSKAILEKKTLRDFGVPGPRLSVHDVEAVVALVREADGLPLRMIIAATFEYYSGGGYGSTSKEYYDGLFAIESGPRPHWLKFRRIDNQYRLSEGLQFMLTASHFKAIVEALRDDIHSYAQQLKSDEQLIAPLFEQIQAFSKNIAN